jgi:hydrogenase maturation protease
MNAPVLIAGIGNIFHGDDAFGVAVARDLAGMDLPDIAWVMDAGIRGIDVCFALLDYRELTILIDAAPRGGEPGTLYLIEIDPEQIPADAQDLELPNSHGLDPLPVLALAKRMGAQFGKLLLVGCEPLTVDRDDTGEIGLSPAVQSAVAPAARIVLDLLREFETKQKGRFAPDAVTQTGGDCGRGAGGGGYSDELG